MLPISPQEDPLVLSPMVDVTDAAFRSIARDNGADVTMSEMISAAGLVRDHPGAWDMARPWPGESPFGVQFMTGDPKEMAGAIRNLAGRHRVDFVDVNLGCPAPNILRACGGGFLLRDPPRAGKVLRAAVEAAQDAGIPYVSAKLRTGPDAGHPTFKAIADEAEGAGIAWLTLHGRSVAQGYEGAADWTAIKALVDHTRLPVVGNGDLRTPADVLRMRDETGCAGFFIARAAMHDPTVFAAMREALRTGSPVDHARGSAAAARVYLERARQAGITDVGLLRRQAMRFAAGAPGAKRLRVALQAARDVDAVAALVAQAH